MRRLSPLRSACLLALLALAAACDSPTDAEQAVQESPEQEHPEQLQAEQPQAPGVTPRAMGSTSPSSPFPTRRSSGGPSATWT